MPTSTVSSGGAVKSPLLQPHRQPGAATRGVDDEIGGHLLTGIQPHAGHPLPRQRRRSAPRRPRARRRRSAIAVALRRICHSRCGRLGTYAVNSSCSSRVVPSTWPAAPKWMQSGRFSRIGTPAATMSSSRPGKCESNSCAPRAISRWTCLPCGTAVRLAGSAGRSSRSYKRDPVVEVRQHPRGAQPRDAGPDDDSVLPIPPHCRRQYPSSLLPQPASGYPLDSGHTTKKENRWPGEPSLLSSRLRTPTSRRPDYTKI